MSELEEFLVSIANINFCSLTLSLLYPDKPTMLVTTGSKITVKTVNLVTLLVVMSSMNTQ